MYIKVRDRVPESSLSGSGFDAEHYTCHTPIEDYETITELLAKVAIPAWKFPFSYTANRKGERITAERYAS